MSAETPRYRGQNNCLTPKEVFLNLPRKIEEKRSTVPSRSTSIEEYRSAVQCEMRNSRSRSPETREENEVFYRKGSGYNGEYLFSLLCPSDPHLARLRIERLYWERWSSFCLAIFLMGVGTSFFFMGLELWVTGNRNAFRSWCMMISSLFPIIPGYYTLFFIYKYVRCCKGYTLDSLP